MRRLTTSRLFALFAALAIALVAAPTGAMAAQQYPVPYLFSANVIAGALHQGEPPPGANIWTCRPSAAHPRPVVLVHGLLANMTDNWQTMSPLLANNGYCVYALTYGVPPDSSAPFETGGAKAMGESGGRASPILGPGPPPARGPHGGNGRRPPGGTEAPH